MSQTLSFFDTSKPYTLEFYYDFHSIVQTVGCTLSASLGNVIIYSKTFNSADDPRPYNWSVKQVSVPVVPTSQEEALTFKYNCLPSGNPANDYSYIFLDDLNLYST